MTSAELYEIVKDDPEVRDAEAEGLREAVRVLAEELIVARGYGLCIKGHETDRIAVTQRNTDANPIAKAALDAAGNTNKETP